jgi:Ca2+-binding EF-hand superfamily protein
MLSIGIVSDKSEIREIVSHLDKDSSGSIDFKEFVEFLTPHERSDKSELGKHEQMFMLLTKKMEVGSL